MEPLWSPVVATGGNQWQIESPRKRQRQATTVAVGCDQLPFGAHGKEGVDGSSPSEGFGEVPARHRDGVIAAVTGELAILRCHRFHAERSAVIDDSGVLFLEPGF